jgi:hypothetical protein
MREKLVFLAILLIWIVGLGVLLALNTKYVPTGREMLRTMIETVLVLGGIIVASRKVATL